MSVETQSDACIECSQVSNRYKGNFCFERKKTPALAGILYFKLKYRTMSFQTRQSSLPFNHSLVGRLLMSSKIKSDVNVNQTRCIDMVGKNIKNQT